MSPCNYGKRAIAYLIDLLCLWAPSAISLIVGLAMLFSETIRPLGVLLIVATPIWFVGFAIWNDIIRQGRTGQTIGKTKQNIKLVDERTGDAPGIGIVLVRVLVAYVFNALTGGLFLLVDLLFPAFDSRKQRVMDKICSTLVIDVYTAPASEPIGQATKWSAPSAPLSSNPLD